MAIAHLFNEAAVALLGLAVDLLLRAAGGPVQLPKSNEDFALY